MIIRKNAAELERMRRSGLLVWKILRDLSDLAVEGATTQDLEIAAEAATVLPLVPRHDDAAGTPTAAAEEELAIA